MTAEIQPSAEVVPTIKTMMVSPTSGIHSCVVPVIDQYQSRPSGSAGPRMPLAHLGIVGRVVVERDGLRRGAA